MKFRHDRFEIMAVGTQAMQPDYAANRVRTCFHFDGLGYLHLLRLTCIGKRRSVPDSGNAAFVLDCVCAFS